MNVSLTPELEAFVGELVRSGRSTAASEVIREGLRLLEDRDELRAISATSLSSSRDARPASNGRHTPPPPGCVLAR